MVVATGYAMCHCYRPSPAGNKVFNHLAQIRIVSLASKALLEGTATHLAFLTSLNDFRRTAVAGIDEGTWQQAETVMDDAVIMLYLEQPLLWRYRREVKVRPSMIGYFMTVGNHLP